MGRNCWGMMMVRFVVVLALLAGFGCQGEKATEKAGPETTVEKAEVPKEIPVAKIPKLEEKKEKVPCDGMFQLLRKCNKGSRAFRDPRFRNNFISGCEEERKRPTEYAKLFSECVASTTCDGLKKCSENMRQKAIELGPAHFDYLLKNTERDAALKFCDDHRQLLSRNLELERRCKPLLGILDEQRKEHEHDGSCNH
jgi:hypothetical protein